MTLSPLLCNFFHPGSSPIWAIICFAVKVDFFFFFCTAPFVHFVWLPFIKYVCIFSRVLRLEVATMEARRITRNLAIHPLSQWGCCLGEDCTSTFVFFLELQPCVSARDEARCKVNIEAWVYALSMWYFNGWNRALNAVVWFFSVTVCTSHFTALARSVHLVEMCLVKYSVCVFSLPFWYCPFTISCLWKKAHIFRFSIAKTIRCTQCLAHCLKNYLCNVTRILKQLQTFLFSYLYMR